MQWWKSSKWQFFVLFWYQISCSVFSINKQYRYYCGLYIGVVHAVQIMILYSQNYFVYTTYHIIRDCTHCIFLRLTECESGAVYVIIWNIIAFDDVQISILSLFQHFTLQQIWGTLLTPDSARRNLSIHTTYQCKYELLCSIPTLSNIKRYIYRKNSAFLLFAHIK